MRDSEFVRAYDSIAPDDAVRDRIRANIQSQSNYVSPRFPLRRTLWIIAAVCSVLGALTIGVHAAWEWMLPPPTYYDGSRGDVILRSEQYFDSLPAADPAELTDEAFLLRARELLAAAGVPLSEDASAQVIRQENLEFARNEAVVSIGKDLKHPSSVTFNADTGALLRLDAGSADDAVADVLPDRQIDPEQIVWDYARLLGFSPEQASVDIQHHSDSSWGFHIYRNTPQGVRNPCDSVMISIHPGNGIISLVAVFYTPLIDDAETGAQPITQEEACAIVESGAADLSKTEVSMGSLQGYRFLGAELSVVRPNWSFTGMVDAEEGSLEKADFTRLAWVVTYSKDGSYHQDEYCYEFWIDYYTGQVLGGDAMRAV